MPSQDILTLTWSKIVWTGPSHFRPDQKQVWKRKSFGPAQNFLDLPKIVLNLQKDGAYIFNFWKIKSFKKRHNLEKESFFISKVIPEEPLEDVKLQPPQKKIKFEEKLEKTIKSLHWNNDGEAIKIREFMDKILFKSESDLSDRLPTNIDKKNRSFVILRSDDPLNPSPCAVSDDSGKL